MLLISRNVKEAASTLRGIRRNFKVRIKLEEILTQEPMQDADRRCYVPVLVQGVELD
jgi:hypothetical protein